MQTDRNEKRILAVTGAAHFLAHLYELSFPAVALTLRDDLGWSLPEVLRLSFLMYLLFGLGALPMGWITDRWRARHMLVVCVLGAGIGCCAVALSTGRAQLVAALALVGLCASIYHPAGMALLSRSMRERGRALGWNGVCGSLGIAAAPFAGGILAYAFGWRATYAVLGALGIAAGIAMLLVKIDETRSPRAAEAIPAGGGGRRTLVFASLLGVAVLLAGFCYRGTTLVLPAVFQSQAPFFAEALARVEAEQLGGLRNLAAGILASLALAAGMLGQIVAGHLADRHDLRRLYLAFHAASLPFLVSLVFVRDEALLAAACGYAFFSLGMQPIENSLVARFTPARWRSTGYGVKFVLSFGVGALAVYAVTGLQARGSFSAVFALLAALVVLLCGTVVVLLRRSRGVAVVNAPAVQPMA
jgi:MFS family permease